MALGLPKLRWLLIGAVAAGGWVVYEDTKNPRPPKRVGTEQSQPQRSADTKPRPQMPLAAKPDKKPEPGKTVAARPTPPKPVGGKPEAQKTALALPKTIDRPPAKPEKMTTGAIAPKTAKTPPKPVFVQTTAKVRLRAQARTDADVIATLEPRVALREIARSGAWRLVIGGGHKGWVHADYLQPATYLSRRPKLPVAEVKQAVKKTAAQ